MLLTQVGIVLGAESEVSLLTKLPVKLFDFKGREIEGFADSRYGASAGFNYIEFNKRTTLTVILFDGGLGPIDDGISSNITSRAFSAALDDIRTYEKRGYYRGVVELENEIKNINGQELLFSHLQYSMPAESGEFKSVQSYLLMTGIKGYMLKIRITGNTSNLNDELVSVLFSRIVDAINS
jgi:hypothetical protein